MKKYKLSNGLKVIVDSRPSKSVVVAVSINVGAINEPLRINGISHFLEHMLFEGTKTRTAKEIYSSIERFGGELNAATSHDRTYYYIKVPKNKFDIALEILSDMVKNSIFDEKAVEKERKVVLDELNMVKDDPKSSIAELFVKKLFKKHPIRHPIIGTKNSLKGIKRKDLISFHKQQYIPNNMIVCVVGSIRNPLEKIKKAFGDLKPGKKPKFSAINEPEQKNKQVFTEKRKIIQSYLALGYKVPNRHNKDSYTIDLISSILGRGSSGRLFDEIRTKRGLAYDVGVIHDTSRNYGYFLIHVDTSKENVEKIKKIILQELKNLENATNEEIKEAKDFLEGKYMLLYEDNKQASDMITYWETSSDVKDMQKYISKIKKVSKNDIRNVMKKYFNNYTLAIITGK